METQTKAPASTIDFNFWLITTARARGEIAEFVKQSRASKKLPVVRTRKDVEKKYAGIAAAEIAWDRYQKFVKRGSQSKKNTSAH